jgi:hypothetical protein
MQAAGWEHVGHATNGLRGVSVAGQRATLRAAYDYLTVNSMTGGRGMFVYPGGTWDTVTLRETKRIYSVARLAGSQNGENPIVNDPYLLKPYYITKDVPVAQIIADIDKLKDRGGLLVMTFHDIVASISATEDMLIADFQAVTAHIAASGVPTFRPSEVFELSAR